MFVCFSVVFDQVFANQTERQTDRQTDREKARAGGRGRQGGGGWGGEGCSYIVSADRFVFEGCFINQRGMRMLGDGGRATRDAEFRGRREVGARMTVE